MDFCEFGDLVVLGRGEVVQNLNFFSYIVGDIHLDMLGMGDRPVRKLNRLFVVPSRRLLRVEHLHYFPLSLVVHALKLIMN
jgi:hypothetical protein